MPPEAPVAADDLGEHLVELAPHDAFAPMRWIDRYGDQQSPLLRTDEIRSLLAGAPPPLVVREGSTIIGGLIWRPIPDLAEFFDIPVHEVAAIVVRPGADRSAVVAQLLRALRETLGGEAGLVMFRTEADDVEALAGATQTGFQLREISMAFINDYERCHRNAPFDAEGIAIHSFDDGPLPEAMHAVLRQAPTGIVDDHYHADPRLDDARCDALYDRKRDRVLEGVGADVLIYRKIDGIYHGYGTFKRETSVAPRGIGLLNGALGYRLPGQGVGPVGALATFICSTPLLDCRFLQWDTQLTNHRLVNMIIGPRSLRLGRTTCMLHCWTDQL